MKTSIINAPFKWLAKAIKTGVLVFAVSALAISPTFADHDNGQHKGAKQGNKYGHHKKHGKYEVHKAYRPNPPPIYRYVQPVYVPPPVYYPPQQAPGVNLFLPFPEHP